MQRCVWSPGTVAVSGGFWQHRLHRLLDRTLWQQYQQLEQTGRIANFRHAAGREPGSHHGRVYDDSDVYKWLEAASWALAFCTDPRLSQLVDDLIALIHQAQQPDGYLNTYYTLVRPAPRWERLAWDHELYCAGHLMQAAVAHHRVTGQRTLLDVACRFADLICDTFGPAEQGKRPGTDGHPEIEMALVELARETGNRRYLAQAQYFLDARGYGLAGGDPYRQDHVPFRQLHELIGHAVRAVYLAAGAADIVAETRDTSLLATLTRLWHDMVTTKLYVTGGIGARHEGEAFGKPYELPNARAYAETCAAVGLIFWAWRMLLMSGEAQYADVLEVALYNAALSGISLDGQSYFYVNPLADDGTHRRQPWFDCACCPPNLARLLASLPGYFFTVTSDTVWIQLYAASEAVVPLPNGPAVHLRQETAYPWEGEVSLTLETAGDYGLALRIPQWCTAGGTLRVNGRVAGEAGPGSYLHVRRNWRHGDRVELHLPMPPRRLLAHPFVAENVGRVAITRGPLVYCLEGVDHPGVDLRTVCLPRTAPLVVEPTHDELGEIVSVRATGLVKPVPLSWQGRLYRDTDDADTEAAPPSTAVPLRFIPYFAWANRSPGQMLVWIHEP